MIVGNQLTPSMSRYSKIVVRQSIVSHDNFWYNYSILRIYRKGYAQLFQRFIRPYVKTFTVRAWHHKRAVIVLHTLIR